MSYSKKFIYKKSLNNSAVLLFIHGAGCDYSFWSNLNRYFYYKKFPTLSISLPGHGYNFDKALTTIERMTEYVALILKNLKIKKIIPIGHSMGSLICLSLAEKKIIELERMILIGTALPMKVSDFLLVQSKKDEAKAINNMINWGLPGPIKLSGGNITGLSLPNYIYNLMSKNSINILNKDLNACNNFSLEENKVREITTPALIISGDKDIMTPKDSSIQLKNTLPNAKLEILDECGHFHTLECANQVRKIITNYVAHDKDKTKI